MNKNDKVDVPTDTPEQRFYNDRLKKARENNLADQRLIATAAHEMKVVTLPPVKTKGDQTVDNARAGSLKIVDDAVIMIEGSARLLKKIGVDSEVKQALEDGLKAFTPYRRLRKQGR